MGETCVESAGRTRRGKWKGDLTPHMQSRGETMSEPKDCSARADGACSGESALYCDSWGSAYQRPGICVRIKPQDSTTEIHFPLTAGKPGSVEVEWLAYGHYHVITELGKKQIVLFSTQSYLSPTLNLKLLVERSTDMTLLRSLFTLKK